jgi:cellulose synthase operon protein YhjQ
MTDPKLPNDSGEATTPDDVATLYSWANLHGAKYRDFSASRAQAREEARLRVEEAEAAERKRQEEEAERKAQEEAQIAARLAAEAAEAARQAEAERIAEIARQAEAERQAVLAAQEAQRQAALQRSWQPPAPEAYQGNYPNSFAGNVPPVEEPAHPVASFDMENTPADRYEARPQYPGDANERGIVPSQNFPGGAAIRPSQPVSPAAPQPQAAQRPASSVRPGGQTFPNSPYPPLGSAQVSNAAGAGFISPSTSAPYPDYSDEGKGQPSYPATSYQPEFSGNPYPSSPQQQFSSSPWSIPDPRESQEMASHPAWLAPEPQEAPPAPRIPQSQRPAPPVVPVQAPKQSPFQSTAQSTLQAPPQSSFQPPVQQQAPQYSSPYGQGIGPSYAVNPGQPPANPAPTEDALTSSRERVANRWYALKSVFDPQAAPVEQQPQQPPARVPVLAVFSLAGGVGKTSLVASLGRALSSRGERVLLVDTAAYGLLPFFFGARDQRPGQLRTFNPPGASVDAPIQLVTLDPEAPPAEAQQLPVNQDPNQSLQQVLHAVQNQAAQSQDWLAQEVMRYSRGVNRILIDLPTASGATTRRILRMGPVVLVPVAPDMSSVVSVGAIESFFRHNGASVNGKPILPYYVLNQFDYSLPLHLDVREILREQIGERLLPFALRRSPAVSEALAEGMTVIDYAPTASVAEDYAHLAEWVRSLSAPATQTYRGVRWSER